MTDTKNINPMQHGYLNAFINRASITPSGNIMIGVKPA